MSRLRALRSLAEEWGMLLRVIIILSLRNFLACLNLINHWKKPTQYKKQTKQENCWRFLKFFLQFAIAPTGGWRLIKRAIKNMFQGELLLEGAASGNKKPLH